MKNQFFGDKRDFFKYDLWLEIAERAPGIGRLTYVPMLTENDASGQGGRTSYPPGKRRGDLYRFLQSCVTGGCRSIVHLRRFLADGRLPYQAYKDEPSGGREFFSQESRNSYFKDIPTEWLRDSAVLVDPDTGLEPARKVAGTEHLMYQELVSLVNRTSGNSVVLVFQFLQNDAVRGERDLEEKHDRLRAMLPNGVSVCWVAERRGRYPGPLAFFVMASGPKVSGAIESVIDEYSAKHGLLHSEPSAPRSENKLARQSGSATNHEPRATNGPVGILAIQGDFELHAKMLERTNTPWKLIKHVVDLRDMGGLILPGGESTTMLNVFADEGMDAAIRDFAATGKPIFGTCAGAILLAKEVLNPRQDRLGLMDITVERNAYGRQIDSAVRTGECPELSDRPVEMVFIRAPIIRRVGPGVRVLGRTDGLPVLVEQGSLLAATFHPELTEDETIHRYFLRKLETGN